MKPGFFWCFKRCNRCSKFLLLYPGWLLTGAVLTHHFSACFKTGALFTHTLHQCHKLHGDFPLIEGKKAKCSITEMDGHEDEDEPDDWWMRNLSRQLAISSRLVGWQKANSSGRWSSIDTLCSVRWNQNKWCDCLFVGILSPSTAKGYIRAEHVVWAKTIMNWLNIYM